MPKTPKGHKRPADVIGNAVHVMKIATGDIQENAPIASAKNVAAVELGRMGGQARAKNLSSRKKSAIAREAANARWTKRQSRGRAKKQIT